MSTGAGKPLHHCIALHHSARTKILCVTTRKSSEKSASSSFVPKLVFFLSFSLTATSDSAASILCFRLLPDRLGPRGRTRVTRKAPRAGTQGSRQRRRRGAHSGMQPGPAGLGAGTCSHDCREGTGKIPPRKELLLLVHGDGPGDHRGKSIRGRSHVIQLQRL